jgi:HlyD family secretion protein
MLKERHDQLLAEIKGLEAQYASRQKELVVASRELAAVLPLYDKGFASAQRYSALQREAARLEGEVGKLKGDLARTRAALAEASLRITQAEKDYTQTVVDELRKVQAQLAELEEQRTALADKLARSQIRAPRAGRVHALSAHTEGGVITAGASILQIIPEGEKLLVEAQLQPSDIDKVRTGLPAGIRFTAFNAQTTPRLEGNIVQVSPAQLTDPQGRPYFIARADIPTSELARLPKGHELVPGMPAEIYIETGARTILSYFLKPLTDALSRAFRER